MHYETPEVAEHKVSWLWDFITHIYLSVRSLDLSYRTPEDMTWELLFWPEEIKKICYT